ncbi:hypothetical protein MSSAC_0195 [Methanosarcina siciliae C2J]|uniref:Uncharacterized protein n=1 Tax=Methanosarcina siciliae C2J TaxID=1434118 RepID=A0A0E3PJE1_9EURY|nr:hypothetical protein MSSAC_0195 [Methanosarcina siciliae C2J]
MLFFIDFLDGYFAGKYCSKTCMILGGSGGYASTNLFIIFPDNSTVSRKNLMFTDALTIDINLKLSLRNMKFYGPSCKLVRN